MIWKMIVILMMVGMMIGAEGQWIRPTDSQALIGFADGIRIGLPPTPGPRGLIRVFTPYVFPKDTRGLINFVAVEPIVKGRRGYSEMEQSALDKTQGKRMWFSNEVDEAQDPARPAQGKNGSISVGKKKIETLSIVINVEAFGNGAHVSILTTFRADRPNEVSFKIHAAADSATMDSCVLTATMGNFARARLLWLRDEVIDSRKLWPEYKGDGFAPPVDYPISRMLKAKDGTVTVAITPNESDPASTNAYWKYDGKVATQYWRKYAGTYDPKLVVRVGARYMYWRSQTPIPGGIAFENFELIEPFKPAQEFCFGTTLKTPEQIGWRKG